MCLAACCRTSSCCTGPASRWCCPCAAPVRRGRPRPLRRRAPCTQAAWSRLAAERKQRRLGCHHLTPRLQSSAPSSPLPRRPLAYAVSMEDLVTDLLSVPLDVTDWLPGWVKQASERPRAALPAGRWIGTSARRPLNGSMPVSRQSLGPLALLNKKWPPGLAPPPPPPPCRSSRAGSRRWLTRAWWGRPPQSSETWSSTASCRWAHGAPPHTTHVHTLCTHKHFAHTLTHACSPPPWSLPPAPLVPSGELRLAGCRREAGAPGLQSPGPGAALTPGAHSAQELMGAARP
jgi:hypothetical protein